MSKKILIVDDEAHLRLLLAQTLEPLEDAGVELHHASNGQQGLDAIRRVRPDLVFLDVMMPIMNGFDVCKAVRADPGLAGTHIVILTAKGQELDRATGSEVGADAYLTKPFDPDELLARASQILQMRQGSA
jgi:two-component system alkaline phosphatase synthesis response regulator PhoP